MNSARSRIDTRALHIVVDRYRCCCKGLEPWRRLSKAIGPPQVPVAFRIVDPADRHTQALSHTFCATGSPSNRARARGDDTSSTCCRRRWSG